MPTIELPYTPRPLQDQIHRSRKRFNVLVCHRRFGKTVLCLNQLIDSAVRCTLPSPRYAYLAPLYRQAKQVAWDMLKEYSRVLPCMQYNEAELRADFPNGARITLYGADNYDALRGIYLDGVILDEFAQMPSKAWTEVIRPALSDRAGYAIFIGTPKGKNSFYDLYLAAQRDPAWYAAMFKASETGVLSKEELQSARNSMEKDEYDQEFECSFEASIKGAYFTEQIRDMRLQNRICKVPHDPKLLVSTYWDIGMRDAMACFFVQTFGAEVRVIDYEERTGEGLPAWKTILDEKARDKRYKYGTHYAPHDIAVREVGTGKSRLQIAESLGLYFEVVPRVEDKNDSIQALRLLFPNMWIDERLTYPIEALSQYHKKYDEVRKQYSTKPEHDWTADCADAAQCLAMAHQKEYPIRETDSHEPQIGGRLG